MLRIKQLQNQLADAHFHLNELSNENKLLKAIQKRQDAALKRYEGTNAELPRILNTHHEDLRVLQAKHKKLKSQYNGLSEALKEKDAELRSLQAHNKKLSQLSKDRQLGERDKLQTQVFDLTHRISEQDETIQTLKRKLELETKYLKHQLHVEMVKHKETQKELQEAHAKLRDLERLSEQRLKRSYQASQLTYYSKASRASVITSQSLTNLSDTQSDNPFRLHRKLPSSDESASANQSLPSLNNAAASRSQEAISRSRLGHSDPQQTHSGGQGPMPSLESARALRRPTVVAPPSCGSAASRATSPIDDPVARRARADQARDAYELPESLRREFECGGSDEDRLSIKDSNSNGSLSDSLGYASSRSRSLHARLVSSASDAAARTSKTRRAVSSRSRSLTKENLENILENERELVKCDRDSVVTVISKEALPRDDDDDDDDTTEKVHPANAGNSDIESEMDIPVAYVADEDDNGRRKSDVIIEDAQVQKQPSTSSHLSSLFTHLRKPPNYAAFGSKKSEEQADLRLHGKEINGLRVASKQAVGDLDDLTRKVSTSWHEDSSFVQRGEQQHSHENLRFESDPASSDIAPSAEELLDDIAENLRETIKLENNETDGNGEVTTRKKVRQAPSKNLTVDSEANESSNKSFDKAKLLAAMKAIDDNENIEFVDQKPRRNSASNRLRITENLYRGLPTHKKRSELMKELFSDAHLDNNKDGN